MVELSIIYWYSAEKEAGGGGEDGKQLLKMVRGFVP
jgi:hypothetical protein